MDKNDFNELMDDIIVRENLPGNTAKTPKKRVQIMVCADFEDSADPQEKFYCFTPVHMDDLPQFRLCDARYWEEGLQNQPLFDGGSAAKPAIVAINDAKSQLGKLFK